MDSITTKTIKILHLYHDLMNLYGDWANPAVLTRELSARGLAVVIEKKSVGDEFDFGEYDFIYIGSGTERSQLACIKDLAQHKDALFARLDAGAAMLVTGNSHELFGQAVTDRAGKRQGMLGLLGFETVQLGTRVTGDCVCKAAFLEDRLIGFINRAGGSQQGDIERPFSVEPRAGAGYAACAEGIRYKNLLGTYLTGPVLVRNPPLLRYFADIVVGVYAESTSLIRTSESRNTDSYATNNDAFFIHQERAYRVALSEL
jgi:hypothetical protein